MNIKRFRRMRRMEKLSDIVEQMTDETFEAVLADTMREMQQDGEFEICGCDREWLREMGVTW